jgi:hypothetical protein
MIDDNKPLDHNALDLDIPLSPLSSSADKVKYGGINKGSNKISSNVS